MFNIKIDKDILAYLGERRIRVDELVVIMCFVLGRLDLLRVFLHGKTGDQCTAFMQALVRKDLMRRLAPLEDFDWDNYELTENGNVIYEDCVVNINEEDIALLKDQLAQYLPVDVDFDSLITEFMALWPDDIRNKNGDPIKGSPIDIKKKMKTFINKYKFSKETILKGTENYINGQRSQAYLYCNQAHYFISKDGISKLASECELAEKNVGSTGSWENVM